MRIRQIPIRNLRSTGEITDALCLLDIRFQRIDFFLSIADVVDDFLLVPPLSHLARGLFFEVRLLFLDLFKPRLRSLVRLLLQRFFLHLKLHNLPLQHIDFRRHGVELDLQTGGRFINEIDRLIRQKPIRDISIGKHRRRDNRPILNADTVVHLISFFETT